MFGSSLGFAQTLTIEIQSKIVPTLGSIDVDYSNLSKQISGLRHYHLTSAEAEKARQQFQLQKGEPAVLVGIHCQIQDSRGGKKEDYLWLEKVVSPNAQKVYSVAETLAARAKEPLAKLVHEYKETRKNELEQELAKKQSGNVKTIFNPVPVPPEVQAAFNAQRNPSSGIHPSSNTMGAPNCSARSSSSVTPSLPVSAGSTSPAPSAVSPALPTPIATQSKIEVFIFGQDFCGYCRDLKSFIPELEKKFGTALSIQYIDSKAEPALAQQYQARSIPTVIIKKDGTKVEHIDGSPGRPGLVKIIESHLHSL